MHPSGPLPSIAGRVADGDAASAAAAPPPDSAPPNSGGLIEHACEVIRSLQRSVSQAVMMFPDVKRSTDLRRRLSLDAALAWQVFSLAHAAEPLAAVRFIPKAGAMERFTLAARKAGATPAVCAAVAQAFTEYEALVRVHAGDRDTFAAMLSAHQPAEGATWLKLRKAAFRANRGIWGISLECSANAVVFNQRPTGEMDALAVRGRLGANGFRAGVSVAMSISMRVWGGNSPAPEGRIPENDPSKQ